MAEKNINIVKGPINKGENATSSNKIKSSLARFREGGPAIFVIFKRKNLRVNEGTRVRIPLFINRLRLVERRYIKLAAKNKPEEDRPWAIISLILPLTLQGERERDTAKIRAM